MTCQKQAYRDKGDALRVLRRMQRTIRQGPLPIRVYFCTEHKGWEITSKPRKKGK